MSTEPFDPPSSDKTSPSSPLPIEQPTDRVPRLRPDLKIEPRSGEAGLFDVGLDAADARTFTLYDIEVSIARMLDGKRTVAQVIDAAARIGIPVTVDSLRKFVRQLNAYAFLQDEPAEPAEISPWAPRAEWSAEVRELFQSALRTFRNDRPTEARGYLEALFQIDPDVTEAHALMQRIEERILGNASEPLPSFDALHAVDVDLTEDEQAELQEDGGEDAPPPRVSDEAFEEEAELTPRPRRRWPLTAVAVAVLAIGGAVAIPIPSHVSASAELVAAGVPQALAAPRTGKIAELFAKPGKWVKKGEKLMRLDEDELQARAQQLEHELAKIDAALGRWERRSQTSSARRAKATLEKKKAQADALQASRDRLETRHDSRTRRRVAKLNRTLSKKLREVAKLQASYDRKVGTASVAALTEAKTAKGEELAKVKTDLDRSLLVATQDGAFEPKRRVGDPVLMGEPLATLVDSRKLKVEIGVPARQATAVKEGQPVSIRLNGTALPIRTVVLTTSGESAGPGLVRATAAVDNADLKLTPGESGLAEIDCDGVPFYRRFLSRR